jgi:ABC-type branched-subunit amino acid transport system ATPase component
VTTNSGTRPVLSGEGINVHYGGLTALADVSIEVPPRELVGLVGPNGAGKSTLLSVLSGLITPSTGRVVLEGADVTSKSPEYRARRGLARTFQQPELFAGLSVREHLMLAWRLRYQRSRLWRDLVDPRSGHHTRREEDERVDSLLEDLGLADISHEPVAALPLGYSRLVEVGRALATSPRVVLLDEPLSGLNDGESDRLVSTLRTLIADEGVSFLLIDHDIDTVLSHSAKVTVLDFGKVLIAGTAQEVRASATVRAAYLGDHI